MIKNDSYFHQTMHLPFYLHWSFAVCTLNSSSLFELLDPGCYNRDFVDDQKSETPDINGEDTGKMKEMTEGK